MKKFLLSLMGLFIALGMYAGDKTVSIDFSAQNYKNGDEVQMVMIDDNVSIALDKGTNSNTPKYYTTGEAVRLYGSNTMTITTASGVLKSVELTFASGEGSNAITADCGEFTQPNWTGSSAAVVLTVGGTSGHRRVKTVTVTYGEAGSAPVAVEGVSITDAQGNALGYSVNLTQGETLQLKAAIDPASASNKNVTWEVLQEGDIISFENNTVTALNPGRAAIVVTTEDGEHQAFTYIYVSAPEKSTVADFIANKGGACYLTGVVSDFVSTVYGNFTLTDATGSIYVYGCLTPAGEKKQFESLGVKEGNEITVLASKYQLFKETHEAVDVVFVENHGTPSSGSEYTFDVKAGKTNFSVVPSVDDVKYYVEVLPAGYSAGEITDYFDQIFAEMGDGLEYFSGMINQNYAKDWYIDEDGDYVIAVCAVSESNKRMGAVTLVPFTIGGEDEPMGNYSFEIEAGKEDFTVTPSDKNVKYYMEVIGAGYSTEEITGYFDMMFDEMGSGLEYFTGVQTQNYAEDWWIDEEGDYVIAVCAVSADNKRLSAVTVVPFTIGGDEPVAFEPEFVYSIEDGAEVDAAETRSIHLDVLVEGMTDEDLFVEGKIYGKNFESPVIAYTDFEEGMDIDVSRLEDGIYTIEITKVAGGDVVGVTEDWMPIYEHQLEAEEGKALSTITFTLSVPQAEPVAVEYAVNPKSGSTVESLEQITLQFTDDTAVGNGMITVKKDGQEIAKIDAEAIFPDDWFAPVTDFILPIGATEPGKYTIEIPEGYFQQGMGEVNAAAITLTYTIEEPAEMVVLPSLFSGVVGSIDTALNGHAAVSAEVAEGLRVEIANCPQAIGVSFMLNEMKMGQDAEGTFWTVGKELAVGEIEMTRDSYAAFDAPIYFYGGTKYQLTVTVYAEVNGEPAEIATYTYEFNGAAAPQSGSVADGIDAIKQGAADGKYMKGGKVVIVKNGKTYTTTGQRTK